MTDGVYGIHRSDIWAIAHDGVRFLNQNERLFLKGGII